MTTKGLRHIQVQENAVRELVQKKFVNIQHITRAINLADLFTKEQKDWQHFILLRDILMTVMEKIHNIVNNQRGVSSPNEVTQGGANGLWCLLRPWALLLSS